MVDYGLRINAPGYWQSAQIANKPPCESVTGL